MCSSILGNTPFVTKPLGVDEQGNFIEKDTGRRFRMHGINFASNTKLPHRPCQNTNLDPVDCGLFDDADTVSFAGKPFPLSEAYVHLSRIKQCGYNTIRFVTTWEAIEHEGPGIYDLDYVEYVVNLLKAIDEVGGLYVFIDPHQDVWSRFSGGSGSPIWTLYAAGLEPRNFEETMAAKVHNMSSDPQKFTKMVWATNYHRLASEVMFTLFFSGSIFTPKAVINDVNIQTFLQDHFIESFAFLIEQIKAKIPGIFNTCFLGVESINEPNCGYYGHDDLNDFLPHQKLKLDETPTPIQSFRLGMGYPEQVELYSLSVFGPTKIGTKWIDPKGAKAWVTKENNKDKKYGFNRSTDWKLGECIFAQHGVWDSLNGKLILPDYFKIHPLTGEYLDNTKFNNGPFLEHWLKFKNRMRQIDDDMFLIIQPPVLQVPPKIINNSKFVDDKTVVALHYYDGMSLMFQKWNRIMNVDTLGIMRGRYLNPVFGLILGESNIRKSIRKQLKQMSDESNENVGYNIPLIFTETGMPFNMDNKKSYTDGNYSSQESANDAILSALENEQLDFTYWCYNPDNSHAWGDLWNLEDFSIWSEDDTKPFRLHKGINYDDWLNKNSSNANFNYANVPSLVGQSSEIDCNSSNDASSHSEMSISAGSINKEYMREHTQGCKNLGSGGLNCRRSLDLISGIRAVNAIVRPVPALINGIVRVCEFDVKSRSFHLEVTTTKPKCDKYLPDTIILPELHYTNDNFRIKVSNGNFNLNRNTLMQWVEWDHHAALDPVVSMDVTIIDSMDNTGLFERSDTSCLKGLACGYL